MANQKINIETILKLLIFNVSQMISYKNQNKLFEVFKLFERKSIKFIKLLHKI